MHAAGKTERNDALVYVQVMCGMRVRTPQSSNPMIRYRSVNTPAVHTHTHTDQILILHAHTHWRTHREWIRTGGQEENLASLRGGWKKRATQRNGPSKAPGAHVARRERAQVSDWACAGFLCVEGKRGRHPNPHAHTHTQTLAPATLNITMLHWCIAHTHTYTSIEKLHGVHQHEQKEPVRYLYENPKLGKAPAADADWPQRDLHATG